MDMTQVANLFLLAPGALLAISLHEASHGYAANRLGDDTAKMLGRLTLNPLKHIDLVGTVIVPTVLYIFGGMMFGWAKPVPVNMMNLRNPKRDMALVAAAGPAANLAIALLASFLLYGMVPLLKVIEPGGQMLQTVIVPLVVICYFAVQFNLFLMVFNLLPIPPLDGGRILVGLLPDRQARAVAAIEPYGMFIVIGLLMLGVVSFLVFPIRLLSQVMIPATFQPIFGM